MYIETNKQVDGGFEAELKAAGFEFTPKWTTRRSVGGVVEFNYPRALYLPGLNESFRGDVVAVINAHVPYFGHIANKIQEVKAEAGRRIIQRMPEWKQRNYTALSIELTRKEVNKHILTPEEEATVLFLEGEWEWAKSIRDASDLIEVAIAAMTDAEAGELDVTTRPEWNV